MFDLPVTTKDERKEASNFRKNLLDDGYMMIQFSVYARDCVSYEHYEKHIQRLEPIVPQGGNVKVFYLTDAQWGKMITVAGKDDYYGKKWKTKNPELPQQMTFWDDI